MSYEFTTDWFSKNILDWTRILAKFAVRDYLEVGSFEGRSACFMIENVPTLEHVVCVDPWALDPLLPADTVILEAEKRFNKNIELAQLNRDLAALTNPTVTKVKLTSFQALTNMVSSNTRPMFDMIYIDGSHMPEHTLEDLVLSFHLLRTGGVLIVDDYLWSRSAERDDLSYCPKLAIDAFSTIYRRYVAPISRLSLYQIYFIKTGDTP